MKKLINNKITLIVASALFLVLSVILTSMFVHPVYYCGSYYLKETSTYTISNVKYTDTYEGWINFNKDNTADVVIKATEKDKSVEEKYTYWYHRDGKKVIFIGDTTDMTKEQYENYIKEIKASDYYERTMNAGGTFDFCEVYLYIDYNLSGTFENKSMICMVATLSAVDAIILAVLILSFICIICEPKEEKKVAETSKLLSSEKIDSSTEKEQKETEEKTE